MYLHSFRIDPRSKEELGDSLCQEGLANSRGGEEMKEPIACRRAQPSSSDDGRTIRRSPRSAQ
jgi:hypothetical protein